MEEALGCAKRCVGPFIPVVFYLAVIRGTDVLSLGFLSGGVEPFPSVSLPLLLGSVHENGKW